LFGKTLKTRNRVRARWKVLLLVAVGVVLIADHTVRAEPQITTLQPSLGHIGTRVTLYGSDLFTEGRQVVLFNGISVPFAPHGTLNELKFTVPAHVRCGANDVQVQLITYHGIRSSNVLSFAVPCPGVPPPHASRFDTNRNRLIDDAELFIARDEWVFQRIDDELFFAVLDAWIIQARLSIAGPLRPESSATVAIRSHGASTTFLVKDPHLVKATLEIFDANGRRVFTQESSSTRWLWTFRDGRGHVLANGVYVYVLTAHLSGGTVRQASQIVRLR
jgi:hypothetical protein